MVIRRPTETHEGPCAFDPVFGVEKAKRSDGTHGLAIFCRCGHWKFATYSFEDLPLREKTVGFWPEGSYLPIAYAAGILLGIVVVVNNPVLCTLSVYPLSLLMLGAAFMSARATYRFLDPAWDERKASAGKLSLKWRALVAALLIFLAVSVFLRSLPTHRMANSFSHEAFDE